MDIETIYDKLTKLLYDYTSNEKIADIDFLNTVIQIVYEYKDLNNYIDYVHYIDENSRYLYAKNILGSYAADTKTIALDLENILLFKQDRVEYTNCFNSTKEKLLQINLLVLQVVLHELEHAEQYKKCFSSGTNLEKSLLLLSFERLFIQEKVSNYKTDVVSKLNYLYNEDEITYNLWPSERMAEIKATDTIYHICKNMNFGNYNSTEFLIYLYLLRECNLRGYNKVNRNVIVPPTEAFVQKRNSIFDEDYRTNEIIKLLKNEASSRTLNENLLYGLQISSKDYAILTNQIDFADQYCKTRKI